MDDAISELEPYSWKTRYPLGHCMGFLISFLICLHNQVDRVEELGISSKTLYGWMSRANSGGVTAAAAKRNGEIDQSLVEENIQLRKQLREQEKEIRRLNELNEFLEEASAFFAASRRKSGKPNE